MSSSRSVIVQLTTAAPGGDADQRPERSDEDALDHREPQARAHRHAEREQRRVLAAALVDRDARRVERHQQRQEQRHGLGHRDHLGELVHGLLDLPGLGRDGLHGRDPGTSEQRALDGLRRHPRRRDHADLVRLAGEAQQPRLAAVHVGEHPQRVRVDARDGHARVDEVERAARA